MQYNVVYWANADACMLSAASWRCHDMCLSTFKSQSRGHCINAAGKHNIRSDRPRDRRDWLQKRARSRPIELTSIRILRSLFFRAILCAQPVQIQANNTKVYTNVLFLSLAFHTHPDQGL